MKIGLKTRRRGFTLIEFMVVVAVLAVLVAVFLPAMIKPRYRASRIGCVNNLKQVGLAFRQWALDNNDKFPMQVSGTNGGTMELVESGNVYVHFRVMSNELNTPKILFCPQESNPKRKVATTFDSTIPPRTQYAVPFTNDHSVSYFVGLDAKDASPQMIISGDDNLAVRGVRVKRGILSLGTNTPISWTKDRHVNHGNVGLADGSVQGLSNSKLAEVLRNTGVATNRLAMP